MTYLLVVLMPLPLSFERFFHVSQTRCPFFFFFFSPFRGSATPLFLLSSFTQCPLFHIISYVSFSICLFNFLLSSFFVLCASTTTTHVKVIPISNLLYYFFISFYFFTFSSTLFFFFFNDATCHI